VIRIRPCPASQTLNTQSSVAPFKPHAIAQDLLKRSSDNYDRSVSVYLDVHAYTVCLPEAHAHRGLKVSPSASY
jgi:hypothetical protein